MRVERAPRPRLVFEGRIQPRYWKGSPGEQSKGRSVFGFDRWVWRGTQARPEQSPWRPRPRAPQLVLPHRSIQEDEGRECRHKRHRQRFRRPIFRKRRRLDPGPQYVRSSSGSVVIRPLERLVGRQSALPTPVFLLTHHARPPLTMEGGTIFHFVTDGPESALEKAKEEVDGTDKDVRIGGGVATVRQYLIAGLIDEMHFAIAPVLLGEGEALFSGINLPKLGFTPVISSLEKMQRISFSRGDNRDQEGSPQFVQSGRARPLHRAICPTPYSEGHAHESERGLPLTMLFSYAALCCR